MSAAAATKTGRTRNRREPVQSNELKPIPFTQRRGLFALIAALNLLWIGALVWMYFATVRNAPPPPPQSRNAMDAVQLELQREFDDLTATTRPGADGSPSAPR